MKERYSYMNNTKWTKVLNCFSELKDYKDRPQAFVKTLDDDYLYPFDIHIGVTEGHGYTRDGTCGPIKLSTIEWIKVLRNNDVKEYKDGKLYRVNKGSYDISIFKQCLESLGEFEYDYDEAHLIIYGYKDAIQ